MRCLQKTSQPLKRMKYIDYIAVDIALTRKRKFQITYFLGERNSNLNSFNWSSVRKMINTLLKEIQSGPTNAFMRITAIICMANAPSIRHQVLRIQASLSDGLFIVKQSNQITYNINIVSY